jgi:hypothetical protein
MTDLSTKNCGLCEHFKIKEDRFLDRSFEHYCTRGKEKYLGGDNFSERQHVCGGFLKKIRLENWRRYPWEVIKTGFKTAVIWNSETEEAKVLSREDALIFIRNLEAKR